MLLVLEMEHSSLSHFELYNLITRPKQTVHLGRILHAPTLQPKLYEVGLSHRAPWNLTPIHKCIILIAWKHCLEYNYYYYYRPYTCCEVHVMQAKLISVDF
jgi:hypothetical protein